MPDAELAARIRTEILERPEHHDQGMYLNGVDVLKPEDDLSHGSRGSCGTTLCVAGFAAHLTGYTIELVAAWQEDMVIAYKPGKDIRLIFDAAREELGLSNQDAVWLFWGNRTPDEVLAALGQLAAGAPHLSQVASPREV
ncbi:hypothetical protein [Streptomyces noursei]|uniref:hypothetical protein n=1 Tax=Streptomyces noursei TaxID=1971 RepID=UPI00380868AE